MAYITQLNGAVIGAEADVLVVELPPTTVLNDFGTSAEFDQYNVANDDNGFDTLAQGDFVAPVVGGQPMNGTYLGAGSLANLGLSLGEPTGGSLSPNLGISVNLNPVSGHLFQDENGNVHMITDQPLNATHLNVDLTVKLPFAAATTINVPLSQLDATLGALDPTGLLGGLLGGVTDLSQYMLDTAIATLDFDPEGTLTLDPGDVNEVVCFARGTLIDTDAGPVAVERLRVGDRVMTRDHGLQPVRVVLSTKVAAAVLRARPNLRPVRIRAGALGGGSPASDLLVSPQHRILVRSGIALRMFGAPEVLVAARQLLAVPGIEVAEDVAEVEYFHILLDRHEVIQANGAETETLFVGPQALKAVGKAARAEIEALFPGLLAGAETPAAARILAPGRQARQLAQRHLRNEKPLVM